MLSSFSSTPTGNPAGSSFNRFLKMLRFKTITFFALLSVVAGQRRTGNFRNADHFETFELLMPNVVPEKVSIFFYFSLKILRAGIFKKEESVSRNTYYRTLCSVHRLICFNNTGAEDDEAKSKEHATYSQRIPYLLVM